MIAHDDLRLSVESAAAASIFIDMKGGEVEKVCGKTKKEKEEEDRFHYLW